MVSGLLLQEKCHFSAGAGCNKWTGWTGRVAAYGARRPTIFSAPATGGLAHSDQLEITRMTILPEAICRRNFGSGRRPASGLASPLLS